MPRTKATAVPITEKDARGYSYVGGKLRRNGGVTAIAAINGRGAYAANLKAREVTGGKKPGLARRAAKSFVKQALQEPLVLRMHPVKRLYDSSQRKFREKALKSLGSRSEPMLNTNPRRHQKASAKQLAARAAFARKAKLGLFRKNPGRHHALIMPAVARPVGGKGHTLRMHPRTSQMSASHRERVRHASGMRRNPARIFSGAARSAGQELPRFAMTGERGDAVIGMRKTVRHSLVKPGRRSLSARSLSGSKTVKMPTKTRASRRKTRKAPTALAAARAQEKRMATKRRHKRTLKARAAAKVSTAKRSIHRKKAAKKTTHRKVRRTAAQKAASKRNIKKAQRASKRSVHRKSVKHTTKRVHRKARRTAAQKAASKRNIKKAQRASKRAAGGRSARKVHRKASKHAVERTVHRKARRTAAQKAASKRNIKKAQRASKRSVHRKGKKTYRKNGMHRNRHHAMHHGLMRRNDGLGVFGTALKVGGIATIGFVGHKFATSLINGLIIDRLVSKGVQAAAETPATAPAAAGLGAAQPLIGGVVGGGAVLALGVLLVNKFVESQDTKRLITAGMVASYIQTILVTALERVAPQAAPMLAGGEASRLSAMYGIDPTSIGPRYTPIRGTGEYFAQNGVNGLGEYFAQNGVNGLGEYFAQNGLGNYTGNPDIQQAAAGYGELMAPSNHIDPGSDLERELTIAEAAAGVGDIQQAAAGMGNVYQAVAGFGNIDTVSRVDTVIPSGQLWAGTRTVGDENNAETPAGILSTGGGDGIFG